MMFVRGVFTALIIVTIDQIHKWYMLDVYDIAAREPVEILPFFNLVMVWNPGISFGMFQDIASGNIIFSVIAGIIIVILLLWMRKTNTYIQTIPIAFIIGGAIGNVVDRLRFEAVADFFDFHVAGYHWPAFNIADSAVFIGAVMLCVEALFCHRKEETKNETS